MSEITPAPTPETPETQAPPAEQPPAAEPPAAEPPKLSYEDLEGALAAARREAAGYRERLRDTESRFADAKLPDEVESILAEERSKTTALERELIRAQVANTHKLPQDLASLLVGETVEEIEAHAKTLAKYAPVAAARTPVGPSGGLNPHQTHDPYDGLSSQELAARARNARR